FSGNPEYRTTLIREYPSSPEARIAQDSGGLAPTAQWLLYPGGEAPVQPAPPVQAAVPPAAQAAPPVQATPSVAAVSPERAGETSIADSGPVFIQAGLYGRRENAQAQADRLRAFAPSIIERTVNGSQYWAVTIAPGSDYNHTILRLKDAGFESFPVF
ncbi:MAG: SPOR domain-containing protein, partial [Spirochaetaceae bacterium]|nr:SPOR domain-containing protein [Spirochaetaceae bacterium]